MGMPKFVRLLFALYFYLLMSIAFVAILGLQVLFSIVGFPFFFVVPGFRQKYLSQIAKYGMQLVFRCALFWKLKILRYPTNIDPSKRTIVMANHTSSADPWILDYLIHGACIFVIKKSLLRLPVAGWVTWISGHLTIHFTKEKGGWGIQPGATQQLMHDARQVVDYGCFIVVFPEGTRSSSGRLQPFKDGFFRFAVENDCDILPVGLHNVQSLWPIGSKMPDAGTAFAAVHDPISSKGLSIEELKEKTHRAIFDMMKLSPFFDEAKEQPLTRMASHRGQGI